MKITPVMVFPDRDLLAGSVTVDSIQPGNVTMKDYETVFDTEEDFKLGFGD